MTEQQRHDLILLYGAIGNDIALIHDSGCHRVPWHPNLHRTEADKLPDDHPEVLAWRSQIAETADRIYYQQLHREKRTHEVAKKIVKILETTPAVAYNRFRKDKEAPPKKLK